MDCSLSAIEQYTMSWEPVADCLRIDDVGLSMC
jgi:hypothetical protein